MTLSDTLKQHALAYTGTPADGALAGARARAREALTGQQFPDRKTEAWKYTSLSALEAGHLQRPANCERDHSVPDFGGVQVIIRNGRLATPLPACTGLNLRMMTDADIGESDIGVFENHNAATLEQGLVVSVAANSKIDAPLHLVILSDADAPATACTRVHVELASGSELTLIEHYISTGPTLCNAVMQLHVGANASLTHYRLQTEDAESLHINHCQIFQQRDSRVRSFQLMTGNTLRRNDLRVWMKDAGADLVIRNVFLARNQSHIDNHVCIEHAAPHCTSDQIFKGIAGESARAVFNGRIHIHAGARGTDAQLSNNNLLLSNQAEVDSKPELEIYNDDVKCSHGTTVGQMDHQQVFYLRSRGIDEHTAKRMLGVGFINELLLALPSEAIAEWARNWLAESL